MNIHTKLVGALEAIILSLTAAMTVVVLFVLLNPAADGGRVAQETGVAIDATVNATTAAAANRV